ncbi:probable G-protein coupled receptor 139 [Scyliorhinus torazame]|uniref:probable G-protein coupled receptor 139 n=1 Tax=Scyliorhinus torazame TaxID=75743 RepID=UPI003B596681
MGYWFILPIERIYYPALAAVGVPVNLIAIVILTQGTCGLSKCITAYMLAMVVTDLLVILTEAILFRIGYQFHPGSLLSLTPACSVVAVLTRASRDSSVWLTVSFSFDRFIAICCQKQKTKYCTKRTAAAIIATICILLSLKSTVWYFIYEPQEIIDNTPWFCSVKLSYFTEPGWLAFDWFDVILTPILPFLLISLLNTLTVRHILVANGVRKRLRGQNKAEKHNDPEMVSRKKSVILLFTISGSFILLWLPCVVEFLYYNIADTTFLDYTYALNSFARIGFMLQNLSSCTNTFIYGVTQGRFREQFMNVLKYPIIAIVKLVNNKNI